MAGSCEVARATRFWVLTWARSGSVPSANVTWSEYVPEDELVDDMYIMPLTPFTCCSIGAPTVCAIVEASAPG